MPINKKRLINTIPYDQISREISQTLGNSDALALWVYLISRPENWTVIQAEIMQHFRWGRDRYRNAMRRLREENLVTLADVRGPDGKLQGKVTWVHNDRTPEKPTFGQTDSRSNNPLKEERLLKEKREKINPHPPDEGDSALWKTFWQLYPRKADKIGARKRWTKLTSAEHKLAIEDIKAGRFRHADKNFIPYPGSYLNGKRWEDERDPSGPRAPGAAAHKPFEDPPTQSAEDKQRAADELERLQKLVEARQK